MIEEIFSFIFFFSWHCVTILCFYFYFSGFVECIGFLKDMQLGL